MIYGQVDLYDYFHREKQPSQRALLTVYARPPHSEESADKRRPALLILPGGGYSFVSEREREPVAVEWLKRGFNCYTLQYSVRPQRYPVQLTEAAMAMAYVAANAEQHGTDASRVAAVGFSAGGHLCAMLSSLSVNDEVKRALGDIPAVQPAAALICYGVLDYENSARTTDTFRNVTGNFGVEVKDVNPVKLVTAATSPTFLWHTFNDEVVPVANSINYASALHKAGVSCELHVFDEGAHGLSLATEETGCTNKKEKRCAAWVDLACDWLRINRGFR